MLISIKKSLLIFSFLVICTFVFAQNINIVKDINPNGNALFSNSTKYYTAVGQNLFFVANDGAHGSELWVTDGTSEGTKMVKDIVEGSEDADIHGLIEHNELCYFFAETEDFGKELWSSDGTESGTQRITDINPGSGSATFSTFEYLTSYDGALYFEAYDGDEDNLWQVNADNDVNEVFLPDVNFHSGITGIGVMDNVLYFFRQITFDGLTLYKREGGQTTKVAELGLGNIVTSMTSENGILFYAVQEGFDDILYAYDSVNDINSQIGTPEGSIHDMIAYDSKLIYSVNSDTDLYSISNITSIPTTTKIAETSWAFADEPRYFTRYLDKVYYYGETSNDGLHRTDGTASGTELLYNMDINDLHIAGNKLIISGEESFYQGEELFFYDGETLNLIKDINPGNKDSDPGGFVNVGDDKVFFAATTEDEGKELWLYNLGPVSTNEVVVDLFKVYPTLVTDIVNIKKVGDFNSEATQYSVIDNAGRLYQKGTLKDITTLDTSNWNKGIYYISFAVNGYIQTFKITKV